MKTAQVISHLFEHLPKCTNLFTDSIPLSSLTYSAGIVTATTSQPHLLSTGDFVLISNATSPTPISSLTRVGNVATAITAITHDLTEEYYTSVIISGADQSDYNGTKKLLSVPTGKTFTFEVFNDPTTPATGTILLHENRLSQYNGWHQITRISDTVFTYAITGIPGSPATGSYTLQARPRISGASTVEKFIAAYTKDTSTYHDKLWMFVVLKDSFASKDRSNIGDGVKVKTQATTAYQQITQNFSVYTIENASASYSSLEQRDRTVDVRNCLFKALVNAKFVEEIETSMEYSVVFDSDDIYESELTPAVYVHEFNFQYTYEITPADIFEYDDSVALRNFILKYQRLIDTYILKQDSAELP